MNRLRQSIVCAMSLMFLLPPLAVYAKPPARVTLSVTGIELGSFRDSQGNKITFSTDPSTVLYSAGSPYLAPDGHPLTWGEWSYAAFNDTVKTTLKCVKNGTLLEIKAEHLLPNALYSLWVFANRTPDSPQSSGYLPPLDGGNYDPRDNRRHGHSFVTDKNGSATFSSIVPGGPLSIKGDIWGCLFHNSFFSFHIVYHADDQLHDPIPGPAGVEAVQIGVDYPQ